MRAILFFALTFWFSASVGIALAAAAEPELSCPQAKVVSGQICKELHVQFDFSACGGGKVEKKVKCWNKKPVARASHGGYEYTATFIEAGGAWGADVNWRLANLEKGERRAAHEAVSHSAAAARPNPTPVSQPVAAAAPSAEVPQAVRQPASSEASPSSVNPAPKVDEAVKISGLLDVSYTYNFNRPGPVSQSEASQPGGNNSYRVFDLYHDDLMLNEAGLSVQKKQGSVSGRLDLDFGHTAEVMAGATNTTSTPKTFRDDVSKNITQAVVSYSPARLKNLTLTIGKMFTHMGLETVHAKDNWNYSRSFLFGTTIPFWHTGVALTYAVVPGQFNTSLFLYNNWAGLYENNQNKTLGAQLNWAPREGMVFNYNVITGNETTTPSHARTVHEVNATLPLTSNLAMQTDLVYGSEAHGRSTDNSTATWSAYSLAGRLTQGFYALSLRYEMIDDKSDGFITGGVRPGVSTGELFAQQLHSITWTNTFDLGDGLELRLEARQDHSTKKLFSKRTASNPSEAANDQTTVAAAALLAF